MEGVLEEESRRRWAVAGGFRDCSLLPVIVTWGRAVINCLIAPVIYFPLFASHDYLLPVNMQRVVYVVGVF
jgi:hypothetical protein